jgi:hypothetical protein
LDATAAQNVANYRIVRRNGRPVPITRAVYNASSQTVTLTPSRRLNLLRVFTLVVNGQRPNGLTGVTGIPLDGSGHGQSGTNFVTKMTWKALSAVGTAPR